MLKGLFQDDPIQPVVRPEPVTNFNPAPATTTTTTTTTGGTVSSQNQAVAQAAAGSAAPVNTGAIIACKDIGLAFGRPRWLPDGAVVEVYPLSKNTKSVFVTASGDPQALQYAGTCTEIPVGSSMMVFPVRNLSDIVVLNQVAGEGVSIRVRER